MRFGRTELGGATKSSQSPTQMLRDTLPTRFASIIAVFSAYAACSILYVTDTNPIAFATTHLDTGSHIPVLNPSIHLDYNQDLRVQFPRRADFKIIKNRPLFVPSRRPWRPVKQTHQTRKTPALRYRLRGILVHDNSRIGLLEKHDDGTYLRIVPGDSLGLWAVQSIQRNSAILYGPDGPYVLLLDRSEEANGSTNNEKNSSAKLPETQRDQTLPPVESSNLRTNQSN